ncbi:MAG: hypothetical protein BYD32DRAFT_466579 [Podila humilis]|nr:MAG: hypothetical protein BYD32DRAFT_466579 [Podila humilis]
MDLHNLSPSYTIQSSNVAPKTTYPKYRFNTSTSIPRTPAMPIFHKSIRSKPASTSPSTVALVAPQSPIQVSPTVVSQLTMTREQALGSIMKKTTGAASASFVS